MISEIINALALTYFATEYTLLTSSSSSNSGYNNDRESTIQIIIHLLTSKQQNIIIVIVFIIINIFDYIIDIASIIQTTIFGNYFHISRIVLAAVLYFIALYYDVRTRNHTISFRREFLPLLGMAILRVLPIYPFLAVIISFGFFFVLILFETIGIPEQVLNWPIYYGTLYGPFSYIYYDIKQQVIRMKSSLPT